MEQKLNKLHSYASRVIGPVSGMPSSPTTRRRFHIAVQAFKVLNNLCPSYLRSSLNYAVDITQRQGGRNPYRLFIPQVRINVAKIHFILKVQIFGTPCLHLCQVYFGLRKSINYGIT